MSEKLKKYLLALLFLSFALPFIFQLNSFPFVQYGMYATKPIHTEYFTLETEAQTIKKKDFPLPYSILNYLLRKAYYTNTLEPCLNELHKLPALENSKQLSVLKISSDTLVVHSKNFE